MRHNAFSRRRARFEPLEQRLLLAGDTYLVNFQNDEATTPTRYVRDIGDLFGTRGGGLSYGWSSDHTDQGRERSVLADQRHDTLVHFEAGQSWEFSLENGDYEVTVAVGDPANDDGLHTINVEGVSLFDAVADDGVNEPFVDSVVVTVSDGRLTLDQGAAADKATRINYVHIVGVAPPGNTGPVAPTVTEPSLDGQVVNPSDVHMEAVGFFDLQGDGHKSTDWEIWTAGPGGELVWQTLGIEGVERLHTHLGDGFFQNSLAGSTELTENTDYELMVRFRDDAGAVSTYSSRSFSTGAASAVFPLQLRDIAPTPDPSWVDTSSSAPVELPAGPSLLSPGDAILAFDLDAGSQSSYPIFEGPSNVVDGTAGKYLNFAGAGSGFIVTPAVGSSIVQSFQLTTANDFSGRDPTSFELWGTNDAIVSADNSAGLDENWTLIDFGALALNPAERDTPQAPVAVSNGASYSSYKMLFPSVGTPGFEMQIGEASFYASNDGSGVDLLNAGDPTLAIHFGPESNYPGGEGPAQVLDSDPNTKYLNFGKANSGFIVTPAAGATTISGFEITTANDAEERDPALWRLLGTNDPISTQDNAATFGESWTLIDQGSLSLPADRQTASGLITVNNTQGAFTSYRMEFPALKDEGIANSMQIADVQFFGDQVSPTAGTLRVASADGQTLLEVLGREANGNDVIDSAALADHTSTRVVIEAGSQSLVLSQTDLSFTGDDQTRTVFLPSVSLAPGERLDLWVDSAGGTYFGNPSQTEPEFSTLARVASLNVPYVANQPGFVIEEVGSDYRLPVNIAFVPDPGPNPDDPLYFVTELYGSIQVVTRDGTKHEFATGLLDYNPQGPISGSGEQGLTGITVQRDETDPEIYHLYVGMLWDNGSPPGGASHYPKVERITSAPGGLSMDVRTVLLNMQPETQGQSHQISNISIGPDGRLYVHNGDGFDASTALDLDQYRGKILRMNLDGTAPADNPFYDDSNGITARDYVWAYGLRNPFGGAWRASDGAHYEVENGPSVDRFAKVGRGDNLGWDGSNASMQIGALYNWSPATAPVNIAFVQPETFAGSQFPASMQDHAFVSESGPTYASGSQSNGKRITEFTLDANGDVVNGPDTLVEYVGTGRSSVVALAAGPDGLYFSSLYEDSGDSGPTASGARIYRVRYVNPLQGDYDIDGDVDQDDYTVWRESFGSDLLLAADGNDNSVVDSADYTVWRDAFASFSAQASQAQALTSADADELALSVVQSDDVASVHNRNHDPRLEESFATFGLESQAVVGSPGASSPSIADSLHAQKTLLLIESDANVQPANSTFGTSLDTGGGDEEESSQDEPFGDLHLWAE